LLPQPRHRAWVVRPARCHSLDHGPADVFVRIGDGMLAEEPADTGMPGQLAASTCTAASRMLQELASAAQFSINWQLCWSTGSRAIVMRAARVGHHQ